jgi:Predicted integral membrane protein (DUF2269)
VYQWLVFVHLFGLVLFVLAHGASAVMALVIRAQREPVVVASYLNASKAAVSGAYVGLLLLGIGGLGAAWNAGLLLAPWVIASYVVVVLVIGVMYGVATPYYAELRTLVGEAPDAVDRSALASALESRRPDLLAGAGLLGLAVLVWLMVFKPG